MLDINDFIKERGGVPEKIKASQRRRFSSEALVDDVIAFSEEMQKSTAKSPMSNISLCSYAVARCEATRIG